MDKIAIVGAGLCGSLLATYFAKRGMDVDVYEYRSDIRNAKAAAGRSINMALSTRGITALKGVGMFEEVSKYMIPMKGRMIHVPDAEVSLQAYGVREDQVINSISRKKLNEILMDAADQHELIDLYFQQKCVAYDRKVRSLTFEDQDTKETYTKKYDYIFGTDGAFSKVRAHMMKQDRFNYTQSYIPQGYKELCIPAAQDGSFKIEPHALHIWPRKKFMLIALPNQDGSFTCTLFLDFEGDPGFDDLKTRDQVTSFMKEYFPDAYELMENAEDQFLENPTSSLVTIYCDPWHVQDHTLLLGDASHAIVPFFGQGMNASFEDVRLFFEKADQYKDLGKAIVDFGKSRKKDADAIAKMALENFVEMRDSVSDPEYIKRRKVAQDLERKDPNTFQSRYTMVSFTNMPYAQVYRQGEKNKDIVESLL